MFTTYFKTVLLFEFFEKENIQEIKQQWANKNIPILFMSQQWVSKKSGSAQIYT